jgi:hypothetical protein
MILGPLQTIVIFVQCMRAACNYNSIVCQANDLHQNLATRQQQTETLCLEVEAETEKLRYTLLVLAVLQT